MFKANILIQMKMLAVQTKDLVQTRIPLNPGISPNAFDEFPSVTGIVEILQVGPFGLTISCKIFLPLFLPERFSLLQAVAFPCTSATYDCWWSSNQFKQLKLQKLQARTKL